MYAHTHKNYQPNQQQVFFFASEEPFDVTSILNYFCSTWLLMLALTYLIVRFLGRVSTGKVLSSSFISTKESKQIRKVVESMVIHVCESNMYVRVPLQSNSKAASTLVSLWAEVSMNGIWYSSAIAFASSCLTRRSSRATSALFPMSTTLMFYIACCLISYIHTLWMFSSVCGRVTSYMMSAPTAPL